MDAVLPVYRLNPQPFDPDLTPSYVDVLLKRAAFTVEPWGDSIRYRAGSRVVDVRLMDSSVWLADEALLWNPDHVAFTPQGAAIKELVELDGVLNRRRVLGAPTVHRMLLPECSSYVRHPNFRFPMPARPLDRAAGYRFGISVRHPLTGLPTVVPMIGQTARYSAYVVGRDLAGLSYASWEIGPSIEAFRAMTPREATGGLDDAFYGAASSIDIFLAYREIFDVVEGWLLEPVWVVRPIATDPGPPRITPKIVPATTFRPRVRSVEVQAPIAHASAPTTGLWWTTNEAEFGKNAAAFQTSLSSSGWKIGFRQADRTALVSHWSTDAAAFADAVNLAFFTGHANEEGWELRNAKGQIAAFDHTMVERSKDPHATVFSNVRWIVIDACGPLQDPDIAGGRLPVQRRWTEAFDGLRAMLGAATTVAPNEFTAGRFADLAVAGSIAAAWFRANLEHRRTIKPACSPQFFGCLVARKAGTTCPSRDVLPSSTNGVQLPDVTELRRPEELVGLWTPVF